MANTSTITGPTRTTVAGLLVAAVFVFAIPFVRDGEVAFSLVVGALLLCAAAAAWRLALSGHILAGVVGLLILLLFGGFTIADLAGTGKATVEYNHTVGLVMDLVLAVAGAVTVYGAVSYIRNRKAGRRPAAV
jgi:uncharacterized membrane protein YccC